MQLFRDKFSSFKKYDYESDDEEFFDLDDLFSEFNGNSYKFQGFPPNIMKQFQEIFEAMQEFDEDPNRQRKSLFDNKYNEFRQKTDQDLDGQIYAEQLDTLLKRISPGLAPKGLTPTTTEKKVKLVDEDKILDIIHGTFREVVVPVKPRKHPLKKTPASPHHFGGLPPFDLPSTSGRTWGKTVISIRKGDGSYEERKMERTPDGNTKTTITKTNSDGTSSSTQTFTGDGSKAIGPQAPTVEYAERHFMMHDGYKIPNLW